MVVDVLNETFINLYSTGAPIASLIIISAIASVFEGAKYKSLKLITFLLYINFKSSYFKRTRSFFKHPFSKMDYFQLHLMYMMVYSERDGKSFTSSKVANELGFITESVWK